MAIGNIKTEHSTIPRMLLEWARSVPNQVAMVAPGSRHLTFAQLNHRASQLTNSLIVSGIGRRDCVAVVQPNGVAMAVAFLGTTGAGVCAPLNPAYRESEFDFYLSNSNAKALIIAEGLESPVTAVARRRGIAIFELSEELRFRGDPIEIENVPAPSFATEFLTESEDVALLLYTSGTTSKPKCVPLTHANLLTSAHNIKNSLALNPADRCLNLMPLFHIHGLVGAVLSSLASGGSVALPPAFDGGRFFDWFEELRPTWYSAVPTIHHAILTTTQNHSAKVQHSQLRFIRSSSAPLPAGLMTGLEERFKVPVIEAYGMTEASHQIASNPLPPGARKAGSVGLPAGVEIAIFDKEGGSRKPNEKGEIVLRGPSITRGYQDNRQANETAFNHGWFRTGDEGFLDSAGYLFITGRLKEIINRGGEKISPREIDDTLLDHPEVLQAVAFAVPHPTLGEEIAAAIVLRERAVVNESSIREYLLARLAPFKVPSRILIVDVLPKGSTGKIQRIGLAEKFAGQLERKFTAPEKRLEEAVAEIFADVLRVEKVSGNDNFFALGGDSLRATQVIARVRARFQVNLTIATIFRKAVVSELAHEVVQSMESVNTVKEQG